MKRTKDWLAEGDNIVLPSGSRLQCATPEAAQVIAYHHNAEALRLWAGTEVLRMLGDKIVALAGRGLVEDDLSELFDEWEEQAVVEEQEDRDGQKVAATFEAAIKHKHRKENT